MKKQYVVFGIGRFGTSVARTLENLDCQVIAVDKDPEKIQMIATDVSYAVTADVVEPDDIAGVSLHNVDGAVIAMVRDMEASIVAALTCKDAGVKYVIARAKNDIHRRILEKIGVDRVVYPEEEMGIRIGRYIAAQNYEDWIPLSQDFSLVEIKIREEWVGKSLAQLHLRSEHGFNVVGIRQDSKTMLNLSPEEPLQKNSLLYVIGRNEDLEKF